MAGGAAIALSIAVVVAIAYLVIQPLLQITLNGAVVVLTLAVLVLVLGAAVLIRSTRQRDDAVQAVLWATSPWLAGSLAVAIVALYLVGQTAVFAIAIGALATTVAWLSIGFLFRRYATADTANPRNYAALLDRRSRLESDLTVIGDPRAWSATSVEQRAMATIACDEARGHLDAISLALGVPHGRPGVGRVWITGTGYIDLWCRVHRAEEALINVAPLPAVLASSFHDRLRMAGSNIGNSNDLTDKLDSAVTVLTATNSTEPEKARARAELRIVRYSINSYRDDLWDGIVRARNRLLKTMVFTGLTANVALVLALIADIPREAIIAASAFYLIGAIIGLFARLRSESEASSSVDDYGLSDARLVVTPLASGLAAIAGVVITAKVLLPGSDVLSPSTVDTSGKEISVAAEIRAPSSLRDVFDLERNAGGLVVAAVFGLTPGLLIERLQSQAEKYKSDLRASGPTDSKPK